MKSRGAFDPRIQILTTAVMILLAGGIIFQVRHLSIEFPFERWPTVDLWMAAPAFAFGLFLGYPIGIKRVAAIRAVLPDLKNQFYFGESSVLKQLPEGRQALLYERAARMALILLFGAIALVVSKGRLLSLGAFAASLAGLHVTSRALPAAVLWRELTHLVFESESRAERQEAMTERPSSDLQLARLRGAFNPLLQLLFAAVLLVCVIAIAFLFESEAWARTDLLLAPILFVAGLAAGYPIGQRRFQAIKALLPQINGNFFMFERGVLTRSADGEIVVKIQFLFWAGTYILAIFVPVVTGGRLVLVVSLAAFAVGALLTGQTLAFIRLWLEQR